ncbi:MAG TPA: hypothetical protein VKB87_19550, partial [Myxococcaceae bacterium]|nr:hypothetical protein [Myxococcaceae bacterium]
MTKKLLIVLASILSKVAFGNVTVSFTRPFPNAVINGDSLYVIVRVSSTYEIDPSSVNAKIVVDGMEGDSVQLPWFDPPDYWSGIISIAGISPGPLNLIVSATDIFGTRGEGSEQIFMQTALTITSPISGTVSFLPGTSTLHLGAACADRGGCTLSVLTPGGWITAGDRLDVDLPVTDPPFHDAGQYLFDFYATGPAPVFFEAFFRVPIYLEDTTPNLSELVAVNGPVVDYDGGRVLHVLHPRSDPVHDPLGIYDLAALTDVSIGDPDLGPYTVSWSRRVARLTPFGAVFLYELNETMPPYFTR